MPADAPVRLKLTFAELPAEVMTPFDPYTGSLSRAWLQDEVVTIMRLPEEVRIPRRIACRYVKIEVLAESYFDFVKEMEDIVSGTRDIGDQVNSLFQEVEDIDINELKNELKN